MPTVKSTNRADGSSPRTGETQPSSGLTEVLMVAGDEARQGAPRPLVLFDGLCGLCDRAVQFIIAADPAGLFRFAPLQGALAAHVLARHRDPGGRASPDSLVLVEGLGTDAETLSFRSDAVLDIASRLPGWRRRLARWLRILPRPLRDLAYALVARLRYRLFGRREACAIPSPETRGRFL